MGFAGTGTAGCGYCRCTLLKELRTDYIDVVSLHCLTDPQWPTQYAKQMEILDELKTKGLSGLTEYPAILWER